MAGKKINLAPMVDQGLLIKSFGLESSSKRFYNFNVKLEIDIKRAEVKAKPTDKSPIRDKSLGDDFFSGNPLAQSQAMPKLGKVTLVANDFQDEFNPLA